MKSHNANQFRLKPQCPKEDDEQILLATWLDKNHILFYHVPNGGRRSMAEAMKFKRMGVKPGVPDVSIPIARGGYHGLYIELKRLNGGIVSDAQKYWKESLTKEGYCVEIVKGHKAAIELVEKYLAM